MLKTNIINAIVCIAIGLVGTLGGCALFNTPQPQIQTQPVVAVSQSNVEVYFPRQGDAPANVLATLYGSTKTSLDIAIYSLTHPVIVKAITDTKKRGIPIRVVTDKTQAGGKSQQVALDTLLLNGIPCKIDNHSGLMHLKMSIIDGSIVTTGSYNYSMAASEDNDEMLLVIRGDYNLIGRSIIEFNRMWNNPQFIPVIRSY